jgi:hypothetical protein
MRPAGLRSHLERVMIRTGQRYLDSNAFLVGVAATNEDFTLLLLDVRIARTAIRLLATRQKRVA